MYFIEIAPFVWTGGASSLLCSITYVSVFEKGVVVKSYNFFPSAPIRQKQCRSAKTSYLQNRPPGCKIIQEAFQYPTRLGRTARVAGRLLFFSRTISPLLMPAGSPQRKAVPAGACSSIPGPGPAPQTAGPPREEGRPRRRLLVYAGLRAPQRKADSAGALSPAPDLRARKNPAHQQMVRRGIGCYLLRRPPPRLPSRLRFRSAIFPSEEERNCFSLSSKA